MANNFRPVLKLGSFRKALFFVSLCALLCSSLCFCVPPTSAQTSDPPTVNVGTEAEFRSVIDGAAVEPTAIGPIFIALLSDLTLTNTMTIASGLHVVLVSLSATQVFSLIGAPNMDTLTVANGAILEIRSINVTHNSGAIGTGVFVRSGGSLILSGGVIAANTASHANSGGGVYNLGSFTMTGGEISSNKAGYIGGGGVYNGIDAHFTLSGGKISDNTAMGGGGVCNFQSTFDMLDGEISGNTAIGGGGVCNFQSNVTLSGGKISDNTAMGGGGVCNFQSTFDMLDGEISGNTAVVGGGVCDFQNTFDILEIPSNIVTDNASAYSGYDGNFTMYAGKIANNSAIDGGGIYLASGLVDLNGGTITGNTASNDGGGVWVAHANLNQLFVQNDMIFSNNQASAAYDRNPIDDTLYANQIGPDVVWTTPFTQGYNNYDISYTNGTPHVITYNVTVNDSYATTTGAGSYEPGETVTIDAGTRPGYTFTGWTVNEGNITLPNTPIATFTMPAQDVIATAQWQADGQTCTFNVVKTTCPGGTDAAFTFVTSATTQPFNLTDGQVWSSGALPPGNYTLTEIAQAGWDLTNIIIIDPDGGSHIDLATGTAYIDLDEGETITIIYQNMQQPPQPGTISVVKTTCPTGTNATFDFITSMPPGTFSLANGQVWNSGDLSPGTYFVAELPQANWCLSNIIIDDPTNTSTANLSAGIASINLEPGTHVTVIYQNTQQTQPPCECPPTPPCNCQPDCNPNPPCNNGPHPDCNPTDHCKNKSRCNSRTIDCQTNTPHNDPALGLNDDITNQPTDSTNPQDTTQTTASQTDPDNSNPQDTTQTTTNTQTTTSQTDTTTKSNPASSSTSTPAPASKPVVTETPLSNPDTSDLPAQEPQPTLARPSENSIMFGLGWMGVAIVTLIGTIATLLAINATYFKPKKGTL